MSHIAWMQQSKLGREQVGGKGSSLCELISAGFQVPPGFCITADGYRYFAERTGLATRIAEVLAGVDASQRAAMREAAQEITRLVEETSLPDDLADEVSQAYEELTRMIGQACAVRSSAISEDGEGASFAGLYESYLNCKGRDQVLDAVRRCYASLWAERALGYRVLKNSGGTDEAMSVVVMGLVPSETSGIAFTAHPVTGALDLVVINASWGLGEAVVSGRVTPDSFVVDKNSFVVLERDIFTKDIAIYPHPDGNGGTIEEPVPAARQGIASLTDEQACDVARLAARVESHYGSPQDVEWSLASGQLYLLQSRPITTLG
jgi:phosphoenolpyruvate synthase/pyruvate phosphate dikinase